MAQGSKSRIIIWTIVGILVVIAAVMLVSKPKDSGRPPVDPERFARQFESRFQKLENRVARAQSENPGAPAEQWAKISADIAQGRQLIAAMSGLTDQKVLDAKRDSVQKAYLAARKVLKEVTGMEDKEEKGD
jgi:hypothetical protein